MSLLAHGLKCSLDHTRSTFWLLSTGDATLLHNFWRRREVSPTEPPNLRFDFIQRLGASVKGANAVVLQDCIGLHLEHHNDLQTWNLITWWTKHTLRSITIPTGRLVRIAMKFGTWIYLKTLDIWYELIWYIYIHARHAHLFFIHTFSVAICFSFIKVHFRPLFGAVESYDLR